MSTQIQYKPGHPQKFTATKEFTLGSTGIKIPVGAEIEFDGQKVYYDGYEPFSVPTVRGAVRMGWLVLSDLYDPEDNSTHVPTQAPIKIRKAVGGDPMEPREEVGSVTVADEEREVSTVADRNKFAAEQNARGRRIIKAEDQEGTVVRKLKTPSKQKTDLGEVTPQAAISKAENVSIDAGAGMSREEFLATLGPEERETYLARIEAVRATHVSEDAPVVVGRVKPSSVKETEGVMLKPSVVAGTEVSVPEGEGEAAQSVIESEGIRFNTTNGPKKGQRLLVPEAKDSEAADEACRTIAKAICPDFPENYVFTDTPKKKMARIAADYDDRPDVIRAVAAAETDATIKSQLVAEYPEAFSG